MSVCLTVHRTNEEINEEKRKENNDIFEERLIKNFEEISKSVEFFHLTLSKINSVISKVDFNLLNEKENPIKNLFQNVIKAHYNEKETVLLLQNIDLTKIYLSDEEILQIIGKFNNCLIINQFYDIYKKKQLQPEKSYESQLKEKDELIEKLKQQINNLKIPTHIDFKPITEKPNDYEPDIFKACKKGKLTSVQWLIEKENVDKNQIVVDEALIHIAALNGHLDIVQYLIEKQNVEIDLKDYWERTALFCACERGYLQIIEYLISKGASIKVNDEDYIIHTASKGGHLPIVEYLIEKQKMDIDLKGSLGNTPLHYSCEVGYLQVAEYLISKGANINAKNVLGNYIIHSASEGGLLPIVQYLIEKQKIDINIKGDEEITPLHCACKKGHLQVVEYLISKGADIEATNEDGWTPLHYALWYGQSDIENYLVSKGANQKARDNNGNTPYDMTSSDDNLLHVIF